MGSFDFGEFGGDAVDVPPPKELSWREDPQASLSDHVITILEHGTVAATYHVHRCQLALGVCACDYFRKLFSRGGEQFSECNDGVSKIELESSAAAAFPYFLDFVYGKPLEVTSASAVALLHLAHYFANKALHEAVVEFMQKDLTAASATIYLAQAELFKLEKVSAAAFNVCVQNFSSIDVDALAKLELGLMARIVQSDMLSCHSELLSLRVAAACRAHCDDVDEEFLGAVACVDRMPHVHADAALDLLKQALAHSGFDTDHENSLRKRCIISLAKNSKLLSSVRDPGIHVAKRQRTADASTLAYMDLPSEVQMEVLFAAIGVLEQRADAADERAANLGRMVKSESDRADRERKRAEDAIKLRDDAVRKQRQGANEMHLRTPALRLLRR